MPLFVWHISYNSHATDALLDCSSLYVLDYSVPARPISEGAAPCPYWLAPCPNYKRPVRILKKKKKSHLQNVILLLCFRTADVKMLVLADLCPCFHRSHFKLCPILCRLRTKLCPNFGRPRAKLCPISFAPCPFPNLAGTLDYYVYIILCPSTNGRTCRPYCPRWRVLSAVAVHSCPGCPAVTQHGGLVVTTDTLSEFHRLPQRWMNTRIDTTVTNGGETTEPRGNWQPTLRLVDI